MDEQEIRTVVLAVLAEQYGQATCSLTSLNTRSLDDERVVYTMYQVERASNSSWVVFAAHDDLLAGSTFQWETPLSPKMWLEHRGSLLTMLADQHYPAPRVIPALRGELVVSAGPWHFLVTTFLPGQAGGISLEDLALLAGTLGRLHRLPIPKRSSIGFSRWNSAYSIPHALALLEQVAEEVPLSHSDVSRQCQHTLQRVCAYLPSATHVLTHGDCWAPNSVRMGHQEVVLIDWEGAGQGAAILDFGSLLLTCQYDQRGGIPPTGDPQRIASVVAGYQHEYALSSAEWEILPEAMRFRIAWTGAWMLSRIPQEGGWSTSLEASFARIQRGFDLASHTAQVLKLV